MRAAQNLVQAAAVPAPSFILESITDGFIAVDREACCVWVNAEAERLIGRPRDQLVGKNVLEFFDDTTNRALIERKFLEVRAQQSPVEFESQYAALDRWFFHKIYPTKDGGFAIYWREISDQKHAQSQLIRQSLVLKQVHDSVIITDLQGFITDWNRGAEKTFGYEAQEVLGRSVALLHFEEERSQVVAAILDRLLQDGQRELEIRSRRKSGEECYIRLSLSLLRDQEGNPYGLLGVSTDITEERLSQQALRVSEEQYRCLADVMHQVAYIAGADGQTEMVNRHWEEYSGAPGAEFLGRRWISWVHPDDLPGHMARWAQCVEAGGLFEAEYRLRNAKGEYRWHLARAVPIRGVSGAIERWVGTSTDIHDRKSAEEFLRGSEERFRLAFNAVEGMVYDWNPQTGTVLRSGNLEAILGVSTEQAEATGNWWQERVHGDDVARSSLNILPTLPSGQDRFETEFRVRHADGHWVHARDCGFVIRGEQGQPVRVVGSTQDITERKRLERELKESNRQLRFRADILATTDDAVIAIDASERISYCNAGAERLYGVHNSKVMGKPLSALYEREWLSPEDERGFKRDLNAHGSWKGEQLHRRTDGTQIVVNATVNSLPEEAGGGMFSVSRDISESKRAEMAIRAHAAQLVRANEDLLHFAFAASHDLMGPLRTVTSFSQLLALKYKSRLDEQGEKYLELVVAAGTRMSAMIQDLLKFATVAGGDGEFKDGVNLDEVAVAASENLKSEIDDTHALISRDPLPTVSGDGGQLTQLLQNLIGNALKYGCLTVVGESLEIANDGRGRVGSCGQVASPGS